MNPKNVRKAAAFVEALAALEDKFQTILVSTVAFSIDGDHFTSESADDGDGRTIEIAT